MSNNFDYNASLQAPPRGRNSVRFGGEEIEADSPRPPPSSYRPLVEQHANQDGFGSQAYSLRLDPQQSTIQSPSRPNLSPGTAFQTFTFAASPPQPPLSHHLGERTPRAPPVSHFSPIKQKQYKDDRKGNVVRSSFPGCSAVPASDSVRPRISSHGDSSRVYGGPPPLPVQDVCSQSKDPASFYQQDGSSDCTLRDSEADDIEAGQALPKPWDHNSRPLKPALRHTETEVEVARSNAAAAGLVDSHKRAIQRGNGTGKGGVLSNILQLYGNDGSNVLRKRSASLDTSSSADWSGTESRTTSFDSRQFPTIGRLSRAKSSNSVATDVDVHDPSVTGVRRYSVIATDKAAGLGVPKTRRPQRPSFRASLSVADGGVSDTESVKTRASATARRKRRESVLNGDMRGDYMDVKRSDKLKKEDRITLKLADILQRQNFVLKLAKALMTFGSPSHRLEAQLNATAKVLEIDAQFVHIPGVVVASFGDQETHTSETHFVKGSGGLVLGSLHHTHDVYRMVVHDEISVENGTAALNRLLKAKPTYPLWLRVVFATVITGVICPMGFGGSVLDAAISAIFGAIFGFLQLRVAATNPLYANIFEISTATIVSFIARGLSSTGLFCYESLSSSGVVMILPGYVILCGSLELASKNIVCGSVRMVYAIIYSLFLGFGIAIGSDFYYLLDPAARHRHTVTLEATTFTEAGSFVLGNGTTVLSGTFTFSNNTHAGRSPQEELEQGNVMCFRDPSWQWYRQNVSAWWLFLMVPVVSLTMSLSNGQPWKSRELPVQVFISCTGFTLNRIANAYIFNHSDVVSFLGAFAIGVMGNFYSRVFKGTALTSMATGVLFLVPSGIAAAGGLAMTNVQGGDSYSNGLVIGFRMVQVAIGITVGLFFSSFVVYSFGSKKRGALFAF